MLFQIKFFGKKTKETLLAMYLIKIAARSSFKQLRIIRKVNTVN